MISVIYKKAFNVLKQKPLKLWGISLLSMFLAYVAGIGFVGILAIGFVVELLLNASMACIYLRGLHGEEVECAQLFEGFKKENIARVAGGMAWQSLWVTLWSLIPVCGFVFAMIKSYTYAFTPYIVMTRPEVNATQAIKVSEKETMGYRGKMFGADILAIGILAATVLILSLLGAIPFIGVLFRIVNFLVIVAAIVFLPLFLGLVHAAFYEEIQKCNADPAYRSQYFPVMPVAPAAPAAQQAPAAPEGPVIFCPNCGTKVSAGSAFCPTCGTKLG